MPHIHHGKRREVRRADEKSEECIPEHARFIAGEHERQIDVLLPGTPGQGLREKNAACSDGKKEKRENNRVQINFVGVEIREQRNRQREVHHQCLQTVDALGADQFFLSADHADDKHDNDRQNDAKHVHKVSS